MATLPIFRFQFTSATSIKSAIWPDNISLCRGVSLATNSEKTDVFRQYSVGTSPPRGRMGLSWVGRLNQFGAQFVDRFGRMRVTTVFGEPLADNKATRLEYSGSAQPSTTASTIAYAETE